MGNFGEDLRMERISRGIALEEISAVTKIAQRHLIALEQEHFRQLPGGILSKGIVRGYAGAVGLDEIVWTDRFLKAYRASGGVIEDDRAWTAFAANVGKARMMHRDAVELRLRWAGAILLLIVVGVAGFYALRYYGLRAGWWEQFGMAQRMQAAGQAARAHMEEWLTGAGEHIQGWYQALRAAL